MGVGSEEGNREAEKRGGPVMARPFLWGAGGISRLAGALSSQMKRTEKHRGLKTGDGEKYGIARRV